MSFRPVSIFTGAAMAAAALIAALCGGIAHQYEIGEQAIKQSEEAISRRDFTSALAHAREAAEARAPLSPYSQEGLKQLESIAQEAQSTGVSLHENEAAIDARTAESAIRAPTEIWFGTWLVLAASGSLFLGSTSWLLTTFETIRTSRRAVQGGTALAVAAASMMAYAVAYVAG